MNLQIIISGDGWVLDKYAHILAEGCGGVVRTQPEENPSGATYLMNYMQMRKLHRGKDYGSVVSMLTHHEPSLDAYWLSACCQSDALVPMSSTTAKQIPDELKHKATTIPLPVRDIFTKRRPRIGIAACRNPGNEHRKGWDLVDRLRAEHPEWDIVTTGGELDDAALVDWYRSLDLYLCPSRYEGGPMGVVEAFTMRVPAVLPWDVGWCDAVGGGARAYRFDAGNYRDMVQGIGWVLGREAATTGITTEAEYIAAHRVLFASLLPF